MIESNKQITLKDIAEKINVSKVTVSKALRGHPDISTNRIKEIKEVAKDMGYIPNFAARNLSAKKTRTIGVIVPVIANSFFSDIIESIYNYAFEKDYSIILAVSQEDSVRERKHLETMLSMRVDGLIISIAEHSANKGIFNKIKERGIPIVFFDRTIGKKKFSSVTLANKLGAFKAVQKAIENGYSKIGHIAGWQDSNIGRDRYQGYKQALKKNGIEQNPDWVMFSGFGKEDGYNSFMKMYREKRLPELLFAVTFPVALGIHEAAKEMGVSIPEDLDLICFGNSKLNDYLNPSISCVTHNTIDFANEAFNLLLKQIIAEDKFVDEHLEIETELLIKETCIKKEIK